MKQNVKQKQKQNKKMLQIQIEGQIILLSIVSQSPFPTQ
jgi:hypothetical protein